MGAAASAQARAEDAVSTYLLTIRRRTSWPLRWDLSDSDGGHWPEADHVTLGERLRVMRERGGTCAIYEPDGRLVARDASVPGA